MQDLNEGIDVTEAELDMVIGFSDKGQIKDGLIDKTELVQAIAVWFSNCTMDGDDKVCDLSISLKTSLCCDTLLLDAHQDQSATPGAAADQPPGAEPAPNSACCVLL